MSSFPFSQLKPGEYIVWSNDEQNNRQILRLCNTITHVWYPWTEALYDKATDLVTPLADLDDAMFNGLPHVLVQTSYQTISPMKDMGWVRGASITVPWDDPRRSAPGANDVNNIDNVPRWEPGTEPVTAKVEIVSGDTVDTLNPRDMEIMEIGDRVIDLMTQLQAALAKPRR